MSWITKLFPFLLWIKDLSKPKTIKADIIAGVTVGFVIVPQSMAYAQLAGLGPQYGLYASFLPVLIGASWAHPDSYLQALSLLYLY